MGGPVYDDWPKHYYRRLGNVLGYLWHAKQLQPLLARILQVLGMWLEEECARFASAGSAVTVDYEGVVCEL